MTRTFNLLSVQPIMKINDPIEQWNYYESLIKSYLLKHAFDSKTSFLVLPEYALGNKLTFSESKLERITKLVQNFATEHSIHVIAGSYAHFEDNVWHNRALLFEANTNRLYTYDKKHLFNFELKNDITPGLTNEIFSINGLKVKILICSDLWFPEEIRKILNEKIDLIAVPAMAVVQNQKLVSYGKTLWHALAQTRSKENIIPLIVSDWAEQPVRDNYTCGASCIVDPSLRWESSLEAKKSFNTFEKINEGIISSTISTQSVEQYRRYRIDVGLLPDFI